MNLLLVKSLVKYPLHNEEVGIPLGLLYLSAYIKQKNPDVKVKVFDCRFEKLTGNLQKLKKEIDKTDVVAMGACTAEFNSACQILALAKSKEKTTVFGGFFPSTNANFVLSYDFADYIVRGEGELIFSNLLKALDGKKNLSEVEGISYKKDGKIIHNPDAPLVNDLDSIPMPDYDTIKIKKYKRYTNGAIYSSRGCSNNCKFCSIKTFWQNCNREHSVKRVIKEINLLSSFGFKKISFKDETMNLNKKRTSTIFKKLKKESLSFKIKLMPYDIPTNFVKSIIRNKVDEIQVGIESITTEITKSMMKRHFGQNTLEKKMNEILSLNAVLNPIYLMGWPGENDASLAKAKYFITDWGIKDNVKTYLSFVTPHPGTDFYRFCKENMNILSQDLDKYTHLFPVAVPYSLGHNGLEKIVNTYHQIIDEANIHELNPPIKYSELIPLLELEAITWKSKSKQNALSQHSLVSEISY